jgi:diguanylate cyclase (GGDEF)-like protein
MAMDAKTAAAVLGLFDGLGGVSAARLSAEGRLLDARGFLAGLLAGEETAGRFREPAWGQWPRPPRQEPAGAVYRGPFTLAGERGGEHVLNGSLWRADDGFLLLAERVADDMEHLSKATVRLANELSAARRELAEAKGDLRERDEQVRVMSFVDRITGLGNQRAFNQALAAEVSRAQRYRGPLCLVLAAIDGMDEIAGHFGADRADDVLRCFARVVCNETRRTDQACRIGDNRFMLMLTHTPAETAAGITERIRVAFAAASPGMVAATVTASFGHTEWRDGDDAGTLVARVEKSLDAARLAGGDRVERG